MPKISHFGIKLVDLIIAFFCILIFQSLYVCVLRSESQDYRIDKIAKIALIKSTVSYLLDYNRFVGFGVVSLGSTPWVCGSL